MKLLAWLLALGSVGFAVVNVVFELTGRFAEGPLSEYGAALSIANWFVAALKVAGAGVALLSVSSQYWIPPRVVNILIWGAAGVLSVYSLGNVAQAVGMAFRVVGSRDQIDAAGIAYVLAFLLAGAGYVILAISHSRRSRSGVGRALIGSLGGLILLGIILFALPAVLAALGIMPSG
jgi:hypothetical protein